MDANREGPKKKKKGKGKGKTPKRRPPPLGGGGVGTRRPHMRFVGAGWPNIPVGIRRLAVVGSYMAGRSARMRWVEAGGTLGEGGPAGSSLHWPLRDGGCGEESDCGGAACTLK